MQVNEILSNSALKGSSEIQGVQSPKPRFSLDLGIEKGAESGINASSSIVRNLEQFMNSCESSDRIFREKLKTLSSENRSLVELQASVNKLNLQSNLGVQIGEAASNTIKRLHQMGSN